jgi:uncharacterized DUF497 family protein
MPDFEWDEHKAEANRLKHGIGFNDAASAIMGVAILLPSNRLEENRFISVCECDGRVIAVVWTPRMGTIRLISARPANKHEQAKYHQSISRSAPPR